VYCGSSSAVDPVYREAAIELGRLLAEAGVRLVFGGGRIGLMGLMADSALEAGGEVIGVIPRHLHDIEVGHDGVTELHIVDNMHVRKELMFKLSDAFAVLPGGLGTLDETFEIITWRQLQLHDKPILIANVGGFWTPFLTLIDHMEAKGFVRGGAQTHIQIVETVAEILPTLAKSPAPTITPETGRF
jgi:uncharacterized protein (TIGR00730 family)